jgi:hypothetical protein
MAHGRDYEGSPGVAGKSIAEKAMRLLRGGRSAGTKFSRPAHDEDPIRRHSSELEPGSALPIRRVEKQPHAK